MLPGIDSRTPGVLVKCSTTELPTILQIDLTSQSGGTGGMALREDMEESHGRAAPASRWKEMKG